PERLEFDDDVVAARQRLAKAFRLDRNLVVIFRETASEDGFVAAVHRCASEAHFLCQSSQRRSSRISGEIQNDIKTAEHVFNQPKRFSFGRKNGWRKFQIAAAGGFIGVEFDACKRQVSFALEEALIENVVSNALRFEIFLFEELPIAN